jgi:hypothetical protein
LFFNAKKIKYNIELKKLTLTNEQIEQIVRNYINNYLTETMIMNKVINVELDKQNSQFKKRFTNKIQIVKLIK